MANSIMVKKYRPEDFSSYYAMVKDDRVMRYITGNGMSEMEARAKFDQILTINQMHCMLGYFNVFNPRTQVKIGECKLVNYAKDPSVFEIGYLVKEQFWKKGYGAVICERMLALAQAIDPDKNVIGIIDPANEASRKLLEKFGFESFFAGVEDGLPTEKFILRQPV